MFLGLCSTFKAKGHTIQHFAGFPPWYYFTATSYILLSGFFWNVWWLVSSHLNVVESVGKGLSGTSLLDYAPVWMLQLLYILLLVISLSTSMHVIVMNFVLLQLHNKREKRRQLRIRSKGRSGSDVRLAETEVETVSISRTKRHHQRTITPSGKNMSCSTYSERVQHTANV